MVEPNLYVDDEPVVEGTTCRLTGTVTREDGETGFKPDTLTLTLYEKVSGTVLNSRDASDVLSSCDVNGSLTLELTPADNALLVSSAPREKHRALLVWTWATGRKGAFTIEFTVVNHAKTI